MPADFLANDYEAIARAMRRTTSPTPVFLHFWDMRTVLTHAHESVEAAVAEAYRFALSDTGVPVRITTSNGTVLMDKEALSEAMLRHGEKKPKR